MESLGKCKTVVAFKEVVNSTWLPACSVSSENHAK